MDSGRIRGPRGVRYYEWGAPAGWSVNFCQGATVIGEVQSGDRRDICESFVGRIARMRIQKNAIPFIATERPSLPDHLVKFLRPPRHSAVVAGIVTSLRHDLPPKETSQIAIVIGGYVTVGDNEIVPAIVIDICKA